MKITCPCKTFLVGEYSVLYGGPAILLATPPYFKLEDNQFIDPLRGIGGFGASGARFVLKNMAEDPSQSALQLFKKYHALRLSGSGADIICQRMGGITWINSAEKDEKIIEPLNWPFHDIWIFLIHTGFKTPTHLHLKTLSTTHHVEQFEVLKKIVFDTCKAIKNSDENNFISQVILYKKALEKLNLVCASTQKLLDQIVREMNVLAAKGCGALGSDVILVMTHKKNKEHFTHWALEKKLNIIFQGNNFAKGVELIP